MLNIIHFFILVTLSFAHADASQLCGQDQSFFSNILAQGILAEGSLGPWKVQYRVIFPPHYRPQKYKYSVVYFLHGRGGDRFSIEQLGLCSHLDAGMNGNGDGNEFLVVAPEGVQSYWMNAAEKNERWGDVITQELIADVESKFSVIHDSHGRLLAGISMGGHGTFQLGLNYPGVYGALAAHSPVFRTQEEATSAYPQQFGQGLAFQERDPFSLMMIRGKRITIPLWMDMGGRDPWLRNTLNMKNYLIQIGVGGEFHVANDPIGGHDSGYWEYHLQDYLNWYSQHLLPPSIGPGSPF